MATCEKKLVKCKSGFKIVPVNDSCHSPFFLKEPSWVPDEQVVAWRCVTVVAEFLSQSPRPFQGMSWSIAGR